ncbi:hypothetical protein ACFY0B_42865 [Streptomyces sp. NPDC001797]|uniref:hypothetical protein n=1 Tax=Streptomyces sp. NPDC001797 TaxID=3364610 RepID=UPI0036835ED6
MKTVASSACRNLIAQGENPCPSTAIWSFSALQTHRSGGQNWQARADGTIYKQSGKCLDGTADYTIALTQLQIASRTSAVNQRWNMPT